jgi:hypothetical protein
MYTSTEEVEWRRLALILIATGFPTVANWSEHDKNEAMKKFSEDFSSRFEQNIHLSWLR